MKFPPSLVKNNRAQHQGDHILLFHYLYSRHKPGHDWKTTENVPDFTQIKIPEGIQESIKGLGQSFNWNIYSIPTWTRFDSERNYLANYAVVGYSVRSIRLSGDVLKSSNSGVKLPNGVLDVEHSPNDDNFSHCHLALRKELSKAERRELRMAIKHGAFVPLLPGQEINRFSFVCALCKMQIWRAIAKIIWLFR